MTRLSLTAALLVALLSTPTWAMGSAPATGDACDQDHELPIVTHWSDLDLSPFERGFSFGASDQFTHLNPVSMGSTYRPGLCYFAYGSHLVPGPEKYLADTYTIKKVSNDEARSYAREICSQTGTPLRFLRPDLQDRIRERLQSNPGVVQAISGMLLEESLVTILLPPNWSKDAPEGTYPILANGFYDLNQNTFSKNGKVAAHAIAVSATGGRKGAIGILWNGGGGFASRTVNPKARTQFDAIIDKVAREFGGDRDNILMYGASRGAMAALWMASNPDPHRYRVRYVYAAVPGVKMGAHAKISPLTLPGLMGTTDYSLGLSDGWRPGWRYPSCTWERDLRELSGPEAHLKVVTGYSDAELVDREHSATSARFIQALKNAGTEVLLEISTHDTIIPYAHEAEYLRKLRQAGVPVEATFFARAGHEAPVPTSWFLERVIPAVLKATTPGDSGPGFVRNGRMNYYRMSRETAKLESFVPAHGLIPFTLEVPRKAYVGMKRELIFAGDPGTEYELAVAKASESRVISGVLDETGYAVISQGEATPSDVGTWAYPSLRIRRPGADWKILDVTETPSVDRTAAFTQVFAEIPNKKGIEMTELVSFERPVRNAKAVSWGISEW